MFFLLPGTKRLGSNDCHSPCKITLQVLARLRTTSDCDPQRRLVLNRPTANEVLKSDRVLRHRPRVLGLPFLKSDPQYSARAVLVFLGFAAFTVLRPSGRGVPCTWRPPSRPIDSPRRLWCTPRSRWSGPAARQFLPL